MDTFKGEATAVFRLGQLRKEKIAPNDRGKNLCFFGANCFF